jgi:hypothetical protein
MMETNSGHLPVHNGDIFSWHGQEGVADISDLGKGEVIGRIWSDACDVGFYIKSPRTGREKLFTMSEKVFDAEGCVTAWKFVSLNSLNEFGEVKVTIFND